MHESEVAQPCLTLSDPMACSPPGSSIHGIFQARALESLPLPSQVLEAQLKACADLHCAVYREPDYVTVYSTVTHSSVLAWRIPGMGEPGGLPSMGLHRVGHD